MNAHSAPPPNETLFARLLFDVMMPAELAEAIRAQGFDVVEARVLPIEIQQDDHAMLAAAATERRVVVTCNYSDPQGNFCLLHEDWQAQGKQHGGLILVPQYQINNQLWRWQVRERLLAFLN